MRGQRYQRLQTAAWWTELLRAGVTEAASALFYFQFNDVSPRVVTGDATRGPCLSV